MHSCLYEGVVVHRRHTPVAREFTYRLFMTYVDLAEVEELFGRRGLWSTRFPAVARFRRDDYLGPVELPLDEAVRRLVAKRVGRRLAGPIRLLTNLRSLDFRMNPVSFYFCFDESGAEVETLVAEVTNTPWGERHCYVVPYPRHADDDGTQHDTSAPLSPKLLHVSPFLDMEMSYRWRLTQPGERLAIGIENVAAGGKPFEATLALRRVPLTRTSRLRMTLRYPLQTWRIALAIYRHALGIRRRGIPFVPHPATRGGATPPTESESTDKQTTHEVSV